MVGRRAVSGDAPTACLAGGPEPIQPMKLQVLAKPSNISHDQTQHQLSHQKDFLDGSSPIDCRWGTTGHHTNLLTPLSGDLLRTKFDAFNRNRFQNYSRPWKTLQQPFQWRCCATQLKMCANAPRPVSRLPVAILSIPFS